MAQEAEKESKENTERSHNADDHNRFERVRELLRPLEKRWRYVQSVLLWEKPTHSLGYFIALTAIFSLVSSGKFRVVLLTEVLIASSLLFEDIRSRVWQLLKEGGFNTVPDAESWDTTLSFDRLCSKLAAIWCCFSAWLEKLNKLKTESSYKYYGALFGLLLVAVFVYQYLPLVQIVYISVCALYFWPAIKHLGIHKTVNKAVEPFYKPFVVQWQHSRTKRIRDTVTEDKEGKVPADSDEEFAEDFHPSTDGTAVNQDVSSEEEELMESEPPSPGPPLEARLLQGLITSAVTQGLNTLATTGDETMEVESPGPETPASFDSSAVFLEDLRFSSLSQAKESLEFEEGEFMEGLEFPDIDKDLYSSSTESLHMVGKSDSDDQNKHTTQTDAKQSTEARPISETPESLMTASGNTDVSDFELLDQAEADGMSAKDETDNPVGATTRLGSVTNYVGKWLGY